MAATTPHKLVTTTVPRYNWIPDSQRKNCVNKACASKFTTANRRHHCRFCGDIFCSKCLTKHKGFLSCAPCREKTEGMVILHETKKDRKAKAKNAVMDLKSKVAAERNKPKSSPTSSGTSTPKQAPTAGARSTKPAQSSSSVHTPAQHKKLSTPKTAELTAGFSEPRHGSVEHTATFSTAPTRPKQADLFVSPQTTQGSSDDPFSTGGDADGFNTEDEYPEDGDIAGDITSQVASTRLTDDFDDDDDEPVHHDDDFAAMLAAADDLQGM
eukprot:m.20310 g.20310  ORF g.20310 m.20310 type:complete len:269 (+) comp3779_c0_seq1:385-1191(+)